MAADATAGGVGRLNADKGAYIDYGECDPNPNPYPKPYPHPYHNPYPYLYP